MICKTTGIKKHKFEQYENQLEKGNAEFRTHPNHKACHISKANKPIKITDYIH